MDLSNYRNNEGESCCKDDDLDMFDTEKDGDGEGDDDEEDARVGEQVCEHLRPLVTY